MAGGGEQPKFRYPKRKRADLPTVINISDDDGEVKETEKATENAKNDPHLGAAGQGGPNKRRRKLGGFVATNQDPAASAAAIQYAAEREITGVERCQLRSEGYTAKREMAAAAMASATNTLMPAPLPPPQPQRTRATRGSLETGAEDSKVYGGIKYERKSSGLFRGHFTDKGCLITIDGEDYVEYRVLTQPSFF